MANLPILIKRNTDPFLVVTGRVQAILYRVSWLLNKEIDITVPFPSYNITVALDLLDIKVSSFWNMSFKIVDNIEFFKVNFDMRLKII